VARDDTDIISTPSDPVVAIGIPSCIITGEVVTREREVGVLHPLIITMDRTDDRGPAALDGKESFPFWVSNLLALRTTEESGDGVGDDIMMMSGREENDRWPI